MATTIVNFAGADLNPRDLPQGVVVEATIDDFRNRVIARQEAGQSHAFATTLYALRAAKELAGNPELPTNDLIMVFPQSYVDLGELVKIIKATLPTLRVHTVSHHGRSATRAA